MFIPDRWCVNLSTSPFSHLARVRCSRGQAETSGRVARLCVIMGTGAVHTVVLLALFRPRSGCFCGVWQRVPLSAFHLTRHEADGLERSGQSFTSEGCLD